MAAFVGLCLYIVLTEKDARYFGFVLMIFPLGMFVYFFWGLMLAMHGRVELVDNKICDYNWRGQMRLCENIDDIVEIKSQGGSLGFQSYVARFKDGGKISYSYSLNHLDELHEFLEEALNKARG